MGGRYLLRIEDTDRARSTQEAIDAIIDGPRLARSRRGRPADLPVRACAERHREVAEAMIAKGTAYRCYLTPGRSRRRSRVGAGRGPRVPFAMARRRRRLRTAGPMWCACVRRIQAM